MKLTTPHIVHKDTRDALHQPPRADRASSSRQAVSHSKKETTEWFIPKASKQLRAQTKSATRNQMVASPVVEGVAANQRDGKAGVDIFTASGLSGSASSQRCPTCFTLLPWPCKDSILRQQLQSMAYRLTIGIPHRSTSFEDVVIRQPKTESSAASREPSESQLQLDAAHLGYRLHSSMG